MSKTKVLLIEDEAPYIKSVKETLEVSLQFEYMGSVHNSRALMAYLEECDSPDLVLVDLRLPPPLQPGDINPPELSEEEGLRVIKDLHKKLPRLQIVGFSNHFRHADSGRIARQTLEAGAIALIPKTNASSLPPEDNWSSWLIRELEIIVAGRWKPDHSLSIILCPLPEKYLKVLRLIAEGMSQDYQIARALHLGSNTPRIYRSEIRRILGVASDDEAVQHARERDWL